VQFIPVPVVTLPDQRAPVPAAQPPLPPNPTGSNRPAMPGYVVEGNAFGPGTAMASAPEAPLSGVAPPANAFTPTVATVPPGSYGAFGPGAQGTATGAAQVAQMAQMPYPQPGMGQVPQMPMRGTMPPPGMPMTAPPVSQATYPQQPPAPILAPSGLEPIAYQAPAPPSFNPDDPTQVTGKLTTAQLAGMLRDSLYPSQREMAAQRLGKCDWKADAEAMAALLAGAKDDPAPLVRAACVRALAVMKANTLPVVAALQALKSDKDVRVRHEAEQALSALAPGR
jgi:hypothetical protein